MLGLDIKKTIAVGDYNNEDSLIEFAGIGYAVENAVDLVKTVADYITVSNEGDEIAKIIDDIDTGKIHINPVVF